MGEKAIGVPSMSGIGGAFKDFGLGIVAGIIFLLAVRMFGGLGVIAAPLLAGSMVKGERGTVVATMAGFMLIALGAAGAVGSSASASSDPGTM